MSVELSTIVRQPLTILNRPIRIATFGDSTATIGTPTNLMRIPYPESGSYNGYIAVNLFAINAMRPLLVCNGGIGGEKTNQMLARSGQVYSSARRAIKDVVDFAPDVVIFMGVSINDVMTYVLSDYDQSVVDAIYNRHKQIADEFISLGVPVVDVGCYGYSAAVSEALLASRRAAISSINSKALNDQRASYLYVPMDGVTHDAGAFKSGYSADGVHPNRVGAYYASTPIINAIHKFFKPSRFGALLNDWHYDFANATSNMPIGYSETYNITGLSKVCSIDGLNITLTSDGTQQYKLTFPIKTYIAGFSAGKKVLCSVDVECVGNPNYAGNTSFTCQLYKSDNSSYIYHGNVSKWFVGKDTQSLMFELDGNFGTSTTASITLSNITAGTHTFRIKNLNVWDAS